MGTIGGYDLSYGSSSGWFTTTVTSDNTYLTSYTYPTVEYGSSEDEDDRSENEKWLDRRVDEISVKL